MRTRARALYPQAAIDDIVCARGGMQFARDTGLARKALGKALV